MRRHFQAFERARARHRANLLTQILTRVNGDHSRRFQSFAHINTHKPRVRVHRAQKDDVQRVRQTYVINVVRQTLYQSRVFRALQSLSDELGHRTSIRQ